MGDVKVLIQYLINEDRFAVVPLGLEFRVEVEDLREILGVKLGGDDPRGIRRLPVHIYQQLMSKASGR